MFTLEETLKLLRLEFQSSKRGRWLDREINAVKKIVRPKNLSNGQVNKLASYLEIDLSEFITQPNA